MKCAMIPSGSGYKVITPYSRDFVQQLKEDIPASGRTYDPNNRCWMVSAQYSDDVVRMIANVFGIWLTPKPITAKPVLGIIELLYLGSTKDRGNGEKTAEGARRRMRRGVTFGQRQSSRSRGGRGGGKYPRSRR